MASGLNIRAGELRHNVKLQEADNPRDSHGGFTKLTWTTKCTICASIRTLTTQERVVHSEMKSKATHEIKMRYQSGIETDMRFLFNGRVFNITGKNNVEERNRVLIVFATEDLNGE